MSFLSLFIISHYHTDDVIHHFYHYSYITTIIKMPTKIHKIGFMVFKVKHGPPPLAPPKLLEDGGSFTWRLESWARQPYLLSPGLVTNSIQIC